MTECIARPGDIVEQQMALTAGPQIALVLLVYAWLAVVRLVAFASAGKHPSMSLSAPSLEPSPSRCLCSTTQHDLCAGHDFTSHWSHKSSAQRM